MNLRTSSKLVGLGIAMALVALASGKAGLDEGQQQVRCPPSLPGTFCTPAGYGDSAYCVAFSPDGKLLASGSGDKTISLWPVALDQEVRTLTGHTGAVHSVAFSPDGKILASGSWDRTIKLWEVATGREVRTLAGHTNWVRSVVFSSDGRLLASGSDDATIKLWYGSDLTGK